MKVIDWAVENIAQMAVWGGSDNFRWKMKSVGWQGWGISGAKEKPKPEVGYEQSEE